jgi:hypothetical protein
MPQGSEYVPPEFATSIVAELPAVPLVMAPTTLARYHTGCWHSLRQSAIATGFMVARGRGR